MYKVLITQSDFGQDRFFSCSIAKLRQHLTLIAPAQSSAMTEDAVIDICFKQKIEIIVTGWNGSIITPTILESAPDLRLIAVAGGAISGHSPELAFKRGIRYCNCPGAMGWYVAEYALGLILAMGYEIPYHDRLIKTRHTSVPEEGRYSERNGYCSTSIIGSTVGLIGCGHIARHLIKMLKPFNCRILVYDPYLDDTAAKRLGVRKTTLKYLLQHTDILSVHAGWTAETAGMIGAKELAYLHDQAIIINTARMPIFDEAALLHEVKQKRLKAALNLVPENPIWFDPELAESRHVYLSGSSASVAVRTFRDMGNMLARDIIRFAKHQKMRHEITSDMLNRMT